MPRLLSFTVFRRIPRAPDFEVVGVVLAHDRFAAEDLARRLPDAPRDPIVAHALPLEGRMALAAAEDLPALASDRRSRRRAA